MTELALYHDNERHSVRVLPSVQGLDRRMTDAAHRRWGEAIMELEDAERLLGRVFAALEAHGKDMLKTGSRVEPDFDSKPLTHAAHNVWLADRVGPAPIRTVSE